ncbi:acyltransferase [Herbiconiux sp. KACC 21604]|uniref:acyltransferase family protein n=1 Tax=unclassified Herbiconiux TaxID=2618217 RepID=UPI0014928BA1|nr:acyltransferase [Herbiconiux sp. SALV-R1]QJU55772.1 acyltransferase [Herbiconiux sp. SALV-R1]WPO86981.1 acyltransferase [Herbiconiux sp. KACC 21604]
MTSTPAPRVQWMDTLRGAAVLLVVVYHAPGLLELLGWDIPPFLVNVNDFFLPFRMPALMLLAGMLLPRSLAKGLGRYYLGKLVFVVWPYLVWAALHIVQFGAAYPIDDVRAWISTGYLWFLFFLIVYYAVAPLFAVLPPWLPPVALWAVAAVVEPGLVHNLLFYAGFFFLGNLVALRPRLLDALTERRWVVIPLSAIAVAFGVYIVFAPVNAVVWFVPFSLAGIVAAIAWLRKTDGLALLDPLRFAGRNSIVYYVAHFPLMVVVLKIIPDDASPDPTSVAVWMLLAALAGCTLLAHGRRIIPVRWLFEAPVPGAWLRGGRGGSRGSRRSLGFGRLRSGDARTAVDRSARRPRPGARPRGGRGDGLGVDDPLLRLAR